MAHLNHVVLGSKLLVRSICWRIGVQKCKFHVHHEFTLQHRRHISRPIDNYLAIEPDADIAMTSLN